MTSPLVLLASNELFERPPIVPHNACHFCYMKRESAATTGDQPTKLPKSRAACDGNKPRVRLLFLKERCVRTVELTRRRESGTLRRTKQVENPAPAARVQRFVIQRLASRSENKSGCHRGLPL